MRLAEGMRQQLESDDDFDFDLPLCRKLAPGNASSSSSAVSAEDPAKTEAQPGTPKRDPNESNAVIDLSSDSPVPVKSRTILEFSDDSDDDFVGLPKSPFAQSSTPAAPERPLQQPLPQSEPKQSSDPFEGWVRQKLPGSQAPESRAPSSPAPARKVQTKLTTMIPSSGSERVSSRPSSMPDPRIFDLSSQITGESPSHHEFNEEVLGNYVYPVNLPIRDYQRNIVRKALIRNLICALPTGLGKTFIASVVMLNWYRWTKDAKVVFVAPTRPLVTQQVESFLQMTGISVNDTCALLLDLVKPNQRAHQWETKRVFFSTPQVVENDIRAGNIDPKKIVCLVVDEAHRATGNHSYVTMVRKIAEENTSFRILALTATPSGKFEGVQEIIDNLLIAQTEIRTDASMDIRQYMHERKIIKIVTPMSDDQQQLLQLAADSVLDYMKLLKDGGVIYSSNPETMHPFQLMDSLRKYMFQPAGKTPIGFRNRSIGMLVHRVLYAINLLKIHGIHPFYERMKALREEYVAKKGKAGKFITELVRKDEFKEALDVCENLIFKDGVRDPQFIGHPKQEHLVDMLGDFFRDHGADSRAIIFVDLRESANEILWLLAQQCPYVEGSLFVGQAKSAQGQKGMTQKQQQAMIQKFKSGEVNVLVATCIAEEGLDIGQVDLIICYDTSSSPIRHIQRMGRTGRKREGNVYMLMTEKEKDKAQLAKLGHQFISDKINKNDPTDDSSLQYSDAVRILPGNSAPQYTEVTTIIPAENQAALDAGDILQAMKPEKTVRRKRAATKSPKKSPKRKRTKDDADSQATEPSDPPSEPSQPPSEPAGFTSALDLYEGD